jgi:hypothetical protein
MGGLGMVDFHVSTPYCAFIEVTSDDLGVSEHLNRSDPGGRDEPMLTMPYGSVNDYVVIDFRSPGARQAQPRRQHPQLYTVLLDANYKHAKLMNMGACIANITIAGDAEEECVKALQAWRHDHAM